MDKIVKFLFLFLLYCSNLSTAIFIYPIIYFILGVNGDYTKWYYFGIIFSVYEFGKFFGLFIWDILSHKISNILLIIISLSFICILNLSYIFSFNIYHILLIRFFSGFFNNIGKFSKFIFIELGLKETLQLMIFFISIICTLISLFLPSSICQIIIIKNGINNNNNIKYLYHFTIIFSLINFLSIIFCFILILNKILKIRKKNRNFIQMSNVTEKFDYTSKNIPNKRISKAPQSTENFNKSRDQRHNKKFINLKIKENIDNQNSHRNIIINSYSEKMASKQFPIESKKEDDSKISKERGSMNFFERNKNFETGGKEINQPKNLQNIYTENKSNNIKINKTKKYIFIHILIEISDTLFFIWTIIILHIEYSGNCFHISLVYASLRLLGEIITFPINTIIIKNTSYYSKIQIKNFTRNILFMNILLFFISIIPNIFIFIYYYFYPKNKIMLFLLIFSLLIRNIFSIINIQLFKILSTKDFNLHSSKMILLRKYKQYSGCLIKTAIFLIGSCGYYLIYNKSLIGLKPNNFAQFPKLIFIFYFIVFPSVINFILLITCKFFG